MHAQVIAVVANNSPALLIIAHSKLTATSFESEIERPGIEPEVASGEFLRFEIRAFGAADDSAVAAAGLQVQSIVRTPRETVRQRLHVHFRSSRVEPGEDDFANIGASVPVRI